MGESPITLGKLIKSARLEAGLTQDNLATRVGVTSRYIMAIENENKYPSIQVLSKIICTLKISADTIFYPEMQHKTSGAGEEIRTLDSRLGKLVS